MGQIVRQVSPNTTRYYWYPGDKREWLRALIAGSVGLGVFGLFLLVTDSTLAACVCGTAATATVGGFNFGRRDARAIANPPAVVGKGARRATLALTGRAAWRGLVEGVAAAIAAAIVINLPHRGLAADWILPLVPAVVGALAHQAGMLYERLGHESAPASTLRRPVLKPERA